MAGGGRTSERIGNLSKPRRQRQRERRQTKGLMNRTMAVHVRYKSLYISLPFSAKQQREMTNFCLFWISRSYLRNSRVKFKSIVCQALFLASPSSVLKFRVTQKPRNSDVVYHKTKNPFGAKICMNSSFELLVYISGGSIVLYFEFQRRHVKTGKAYQLFKLQHLRPFRLVCLHGRLI